MMNTEAFIKLLKKELIPAMGCTEPIAIAYATSLARSYMPEDEIVGVDVYVSGNIIKNVKSVKIPNTKGRKGIKVAAAAGIVGGQSELKMEVLSKMSDAQCEMIDDFLNRVDVCVHDLISDCALDILVKLKGVSHQVTVKIQNEHTNVVFISVDGNVLIDEKQVYKRQEEDLNFLTMESIYEFASSCDIDLLKDVLDRQIEYNMAIAKCGMETNYGANIGKVVLENEGDTPLSKAKAYAAAGSDARMSGCELPVIIVSGSGNQGMCTSVPVIVYAKEKGIDPERLYRALILADLSTIYQKKQIGRLSAYCGAVCAGASAGAGIAFLDGGNLDDICHTIVNALAITSGIICDGAKASCAAKILVSVNAGILGYQMYQMGNQFYNGEGIVSQNIDKTIQNVGKLAREGMKTTDEKIIHIMIQNEN